ncbi:SRPBCC family protein [soil metagenome]
MAALEFSDSIDIALPPDALYALVADVTRMGDWSPVCRACWWDDDGGPHVGAWFTGRNETPERTWETRSQVVAADPGRQFAWEVNNGWVRWGFTFEPLSSGSTRLTESWTFLPLGQDGFRERYGDQADLQIAERTTSAHRGIPETLAAIKRTAESG